MSEKFDGYRALFRYEIINDKPYLESILSEGAENAYYRAKKTLSKVYRKVGFLPNKSRP